MAEVDEALQQIARIRSQIAISTRFNGFAAATFGVTGAIAVLAALGQSWAGTQAVEAAAIHAGNVAFVRYWAVVLSGIGLIVAVESIARARLVHGALSGMLLGTTIRRLAPFLLAMAIVGVVLCALTPASAWAVPGLWLLLIGLSGFTLAPALPHRIGAVWAWFYLTGTIVLVAAGSSQVLSPWMLGGPLSIGFAAVTLVLARADRSATDTDD